MSRLDQGVLETLPNTVQRPQYDRTQLKPGIVHLGVGAFHRAHQAFYTEQVLNRFGGDWGIVGATLRSSTVAEQLNPQDGLYTLIEQSESQRYQVIGCLQKVITAPQQPQALIDAIADEAINLVSLTITEKGYCHDPATGQLQQYNVDIEQDIKNYPDKPVTAIGFLVAGLAMRAKNHGKPITLLSCDNLPNNGQILKNVVQTFAKQIEPHLVDWIEEHASFPCSMVDRIVPATTAKDLAAVESALGLEDRGAVVTEPFSQWVIENDFATDVPDWGSVGVLIVDDVTPFEEIKLRLLNGSHSIIAYLGFVAGFDYVHEVIAEKNFRQLIEDYMELVTATLNIPVGFDIASYKCQLVERFANPALNHRTSQIAMDGSQKIPQRWLKTVSDIEAKGLDSNILALAVAGWIRYLEGIRESGERYEISDPQEKFLTQAVNEGLVGCLQTVLKVICFAPVFGSLARDCPEFARKVTEYYRALKSQGVYKTVVEWKTLITSIL